MSLTEFRTAKVRLLLAIPILLTVPSGSSAHDMAMPMSSAATPVGARTPGFELPVPKPMPTFALTDTKGKSFDRSRFESRWTLLLFGYTQCTDICPTSLAALADVRKRWRSVDSPAPADIAFVTVDPGNDTQLVLASYLTNFGPGITGARGTPKQIEQLATPLHVEHAPAAGGMPGMDHTGSVSLIGPDARLYAVYTLPLQPARVAADVARIRLKHCVLEAAAARTAACTARSAQ